MIAKVLLTQKQVPTTGQSRIDDHRWHTSAKLLPFTDIYYTTFFPFVKDFFSLFCFLHKKAENVTVRRVDHVFIKIKLTARLQIINFDMV